MSHLEDGFGAKIYWTIFFYILYIYYLPGGSDGKVSACNVGDLGWEDPLEKEMAIHSSTLAWKILWTEEPDRLL